VLDGFVKVLKRIHELYQTGTCGAPRQHGPELEKNYYDSLLIVLETLEKCFSQQPKDSITLTMEENQNLKSLLKEICAFLDMSNDNPNTHAIKVLASKVLFALSVNFFNAVFNRISSKLQELASCPDENPDYSDIELIQHINVDVNRLTKLLTGTLTTNFFLPLLVCVQY
jgi:neurofibromin 1